MSSWPGITEISLGAGVSLITSVALINRCGVGVFLVYSKLHPSPI